MPPIYPAASGPEPAPPPAATSTSMSSWSSSARPFHHSEALAGIAGRPIRWLIDLPVSFMRQFGLIFRARAAGELACPAILPRIPRDGAWAAPIAPSLPDPHSPGGAPRGLCEFCARSPPRLPGPRSPPRSRSPTVARARAGPANHYPRRSRSMFLAGVQLGLDRPCHHYPRRSRPRRGRPRPRRPLLPSGRQGNLYHISVGPTAQWK